MLVEMSKLFKTRKERELKMTLAYLDTFDGLCACKVLKSWQAEIHGGTYCQVRITARKHPVYNVGEVLTVSVNHVVSRRIRHSNGIIYVKPLVKQGPPNIPARNGMENQR